MRHFGKFSNIVYLFSGGRSASYIEIPNCSHLLDACSREFSRITKIFVGVIYTSSAHLQKPNHDAGAK